ncbi:MAG: hypothetical protein EOP07_02295 [Proteobacteria bacterium]|nr:MAG: hypothetical protein EOP07_02295 [Pseudomonadota bacterium]
MSETISAASFIVPLWWIRAFEVALQLRSLDTDPFAMSETGGLSPALTDAELNAFLVIIQSSQQQILSGQKWLKFDPDLLLKNHPAMGRTKSFLFLRLVQMLRSLQVLPHSQPDQKETLFFFEREERRRDTDGSTKTMYRLNNLAAELLLGYTEPYSEVVRLVEGKARAHRYLGNHEPLSLRPSVWLDLSYLEQFIFLQLRKASMWEESSYRWDSVFGRGFDEFFANLTLPKIKAKDGMELSPFRQKIRLLKRVGRKLIDHGVIRSAQNIDYLAIDSDGDPLTVIWQLHESEAQSQERKDYETDVARYFRDNHLDQALKKLVPIVSPTAKTDELFAFWREIEDREKIESSGHLKLDGNLLLPISGLFFEWNLRSKSSDILSMPGWLKDSPALKLIGNPALPLQEKLSGFAAMIKAQPEYQKDIENLPRASIAAPITLRQADILERLATAASSASSSSKTATSQGVQARKDKQTSPAPAAATTMKPVGVQKGPDPELRKQASEELQKMREREPKRYQSLKAKYLEDLEMEKKQIIFEMKERMQPHAFDDHLKYSLVKYMVDNPRLWQTEDRNFP